MSRTSSSGIESFGTLDILAVGRTYEVLSTELVCKSLYEDPGPGSYGLGREPSEEIELSPEDKDKLADILANQIDATLDNMRSDGSDDSENASLAVIEDTFQVVRLKKYLEDQMNLERRTLRKEFYQQMCSGNTGVKDVTHIEERHRLSREDDPVVDAAVDFLLDENQGGVEIPNKVRCRVEQLWDLLLMKAKEWSVEYDMAETEACEEVIAAAIAVEVHTGGNPDHMDQYKKYLIKERGATWSQLDEDPTQPADKDIMNWYEDEYDKDSR
jgi:hypothetical protein